MIDVFVPGVPVPQGSKKGFIVGKRVVLVDDNKDKLKPWRAKLSHAVEGFDLVDGPVEVGAVFVFPRPKSVKRRHMSVKPDVDKLMRALGDALTDAGVIEDDARIVRWSPPPEKRYALPGEEPGVHLIVKPVEETA